VKAKGRKSKSGKRGRTGTGTGDISFHVKRRRGKIKKTQGEKWRGLGEADGRLG